MDANMIPVNGFFFHWFNELDIKRYPDDVRYLPTDKTVSIADYAKNQLKYLPKNSVKKLLKPFLYSNEPVYFDENTGRRSNTNNTDAKRSDPNLTKRINNLKDFVLKKNEYRIPLGLITELGLCNFAIETKTRVIITLERNLNKLFESNKKVTSTPDDPDASIEFWDRPYIQYQEITLTEVWETYLKQIQKSNQGLRMGVLPNPFQQTFEVNVGAQISSVDFNGSTRQFDWMEISLVYFKSYEHETIYDSYDIELAAKLIESVNFVNVSKPYTLSGKIRFDTNNRDEKHLLYKMFVAYQCNGATNAPLTDYKNNPVYQDMADEFDYTVKTKDDRILIDMHRSNGN